MEPQVNAAPADPRSGRSATVVALLVSVAIIAVAGVVSWKIQRRTPVEDALLPFPRSSSDYFMLDDTAGHLHRPRAQRSYEWKEHPRGRIVVRTNNLGFREDLPTVPRKPAGVFRILVTGDSHVDGVLHNDESFPNLLENLLNENGRQRYEVLNGGVGHYGPHNYLGFLDRHLDLEPDLYVVVVYGGNDYLDTIRVERVARRLTIPARPPAYHERLETAGAVSGGAVAQGLNQLYFFVTFPDLRERALAITEGKLLEIRRRCVERGIDLLVVTLPTKLDAEPAMADLREQLRASLRLAPDEMDVNRRVSIELRRRLQAAGIRVVDAGPALALQAEPVYWAADHHLNTLGHRVVAGIVERALRDAL